MIPANSAAPAIISAVEHHVPNDTYNLYDIHFDSHNIETLLTSSPSVVDSWIFQVPRLYSHNHSVVIGLDIEWRPNFQRGGVPNRVATLQLCIGLHCLIFQIFHAHFIPASLANFLSNPNHTFVGVGIQEDANKLFQDYDLRVVNCVDLRTVAADVMGDPAMRQAGLRTLCQRVIGRDVEKPRRITMSKWDNAWLSPEQVQYAAIDAYLSSEIGLHLFPNWF